jgi:hypothetical protein
MATFNPIHVQKYLSGVDYPAGKQELLQQAKRNGADEQVCRALEQLPDDEEFEAPVDVSEAVSRLP